MTLQYLLSAVLLLFFPLAANSQVGTSYPFFAPLESGSGDISSTCLAQYKSANASGTYSWGPSFVNGDIGGTDTAEDLSWTVTVSENTTSGEFSSDLWLGSPPGVNLSLGIIPFSGCSLYMGDLSDNLIRRAQTDNRNCSQMLDNACLAALWNQLEQTAFWLVANPTDNSPAPSNLTAGSLPRVCADIHEALTKDGAVSNACAKFVGPKLSWYDGEYSNMTFTYNLSFTSQARKALNTTNVTLQDATYNEAVTNVYPVFTVLFPPANDSTTTKVSIAEAFLRCPRPLNVTSGSRSPNALLSPTPLRKVAHPLSAGAKAGIAIGVVAGVLLITGALIFWLRRRRQARKAAESAAALELVEKKMWEEREEWAEKKVPMMDSENVYEADGGVRPEMQGTPMYTELEDTSRAGELDGRGAHR